MDSMRSLNSSLPSSTSATASRKRARQSQNTRYPPAALHQAFKAAAYSVTQLYKAAAADEDAARASGYQDAVDELLGFLDSENLGLGDGEGWRVRQWATQRLTPDVYASGSEEDETEDIVVGDAEVMDGHTGAGGQVTTTEADGMTIPQSSSSTSSASASSAASASQIAAPVQAPVRAPDIFHFTANPAMQQHHFPSTESDTSPRSVTFNLRPTASFRRLPHERAVSTGAVPTLGIGAGSKRRSPSHTDFDIASFGNYGCGFGGFGVGGKRRRKGE